MANLISLFKQYVPVLDEVYQESSKTAVFDGSPDSVEAGANAGELIIPMMSMDGLGDYSRSSGYTTGDVTLTHQSIAVDYDRGKMFSVDSLDNAYSAGIAYGRLSGEFIRTKVVPELDAYRFAKYAGQTGVSVATGELTTGALVVAALRTATNTMDEDEVPMEDRHLAITPSLFGLIEDLETTKSREVLERFASVILVPQTRFYTAIELMDGASTGETAGGYQKAEDAQNINFMIIHRGAIIQFPQHVVPKVVTPEQNQNADAWKFGYRMVGVNSVYGNKVSGVYVHHVPAPVVQQD